MIGNRRFVTRAIRKRIDRPGRPFDRLWGEWDLDGDGWERAIGSSSNPTVLALAYSNHVTVITCVHITNLVYASTCSRQQLQAHGFRIGTDMAV